MKVNMTQFFGVKDSVFVKLEGAWDREMLSDVVTHLEEVRPTYFVLDPTQSVLSDMQSLPVEESIPDRQELVERLVNLMLDNTKMLYIVINRNDSPLLKSAAPFYEAHGVGDRYIFVRSESRAMRVIRKHRDA